MKKYGVLSLAVAIFVSFVPTQAYAQCERMIATAESQILTMTTYQFGDKPISIGPNWRMDIASARTLIDQAKTFLKDGEETACEIQILEALKRLGNAL